MKKAIAGVNVYIVRPSARTEDSSLFLLKQQASAMKTELNLPEHLKFLKDPQAIRERIAPDRRDYYYLHLSDLLLALDNQVSKEAVTLIDFGAGGSPYRSLFPRANYLTADIEGSDADFSIDANSKTNAPSGIFDIVLSTQVLEHCLEPSSYLSEARRLIKDDGQLILTTHGLFEEHACPQDFWRWTSDGLRVSIEQAGFVTESVQKITVGPRAAFHLMQSALSPSLITGMPIVPRLALRFVLRILLARRFWNWVLDYSFPQYRVVDQGNLPLSNSYVALLISARPAPEPTNVKTAKSVP